MDSQGSSVSPILFIYISETHEAGDGSGLVRSLSIIDNATWVAHGRSVAEVRVKLEEAASRSVGWGHTNRIGFEIAKTEAALFSKQKTLEGQGTRADLGRFPSGPLQQTGYEVAGDLFGLPPSLYRTCSERAEQSQNGRA